MLNYNAQGLIPAVIQDDETDAVLMLGYMNAETLKMTRDIGQVVFWSRSRRDLAQGRDERRLPGSALDQGRLRDNSLLVRVKMLGRRCAHRRSCFFKER
jgi:hypothetical protein